jgi:hypothetical protein
MLAAHLSEATTMSKTCKVARSGLLMEPSPTLGSWLLEVHARFHWVGRQRRCNLGPAAAVGPGAPYSVCQGLHSCVDETCQHFYSGEVIANVLRTTLREDNQGVFDEVAGVVVGVAVAVLHVYATPISAAGRYTTLQDVT